MDEAKVIAEAVKIEGNKECDFGHKVGDRFEFTLTHSPDLCTYALAALLPAVQVLLHGGSFDWLEEGEPLLWGCPHPGEGQVIFELRRV